MNDIQSFVEVLKRCEEAGGAGTKKAIQEALKMLTPGARALMKYAMDPFKVYGIKKFERLAAHEYCAVDKPNIDIIVRTLDKLAAGELTGNAARTAWATTLAEFTPETGQYLERIVDKDLAAGFSPDTFNKIWPTDPVPVFDQMLAAGVPEEFDDIVWPKIGDVKYDGERNIAFVREGQPVLYLSRGGKVAEHMNGLFDEELHRMRQAFGQDFVADGERMARDYTQTMNAKKSGKDGDAARANMCFRLFFVMSMKQWNTRANGIGTQSMEQNRETIAECLETAKCEKVILTTARILKNKEEMFAFLNEVTTPGYDGRPKGHEGLILKDPTGVYEWDRSNTWIKVKKFFDADARVLSWSYGKGRNAHRMGRVEVAGYLEDGTYFECGVGSGWSDAQREDFVKNFDANWKDKTIVVKYQEVSKAKNAKHHSLRFPTFDRGPRDDKFIELP